MNDPIPRRSFVKKSVAASLGTTSPLFLSGLVRASGESGGGTTGDFDTTFGGDTTFDPWETTIPQTTIPDTTFPIVGYGIVGYPGESTNPSGYGESAEKLVAAGRLKVKAKYWITPSSANGDNVKIEVAGEVNETALLPPPGYAFQPLATPKASVHGVLSTVPGLMDTVFSPSPLDSSHLGNYVGWDDGEPIERTYYQVWIFIDPTSWDYKRDSGIEGKITVKYVEIKKNRLTESTIAVIANTLDHLDISLSLQVTPLYA